ncbi:hypothetical protein V8F33_009411 [Rhypophila sp. PSN 637]
MMIPSRLSLLLLRSCGLLFVALFLIVSLECWHVVVRLIRFVTAGWEATATSKLGEIDSTEIAATASYECELVTNRALGQNLAFSFDRQVEKSDRAM